RHRQTGDHKRFASKQDAFGGGAWRYGRQRGEVTAADVFSQRQSHDASDFLGGKRFHAASLMPKPEWEKEKGLRGNEFSRRVGSRRVQLCLPALPGAASRPKPQPGPGTAVGWTPR